MLGQILRQLTTFSISGATCVRARVRARATTRSLKSGIIFLGSPILRVRRSATEVKDYLHLMRRMSSGALPPWYPMLLASLEPMAASRSGGPPVFLHFDGRACGLKLPPMERWPATTGYCFYTWLRAEGWRHDWGQRASPFRARSWTRGRARVF